MLDYAETWQSLISAKRNEIDLFIVFADFLFSIYGNRLSVEELEELRERKTRLALKAWSAIGAWRKERENLRRKLTELIGELRVSTAMVDNEFGVSLDSFDYFTFPDRNLDFEKEEVTGIELRNERLEVAAKGGRISP